MSRQHVRTALVLVATLLATKVAADEKATEVDAEKVQTCLASTAHGVVEPDCVGLAAEECMFVPPRNQSTIDIFQCRDAEKQVWQRLAREFEEEQLSIWRKYDQYNRENNWPNVSRSAEQSFLALRDAYWAYAKALCSMIYAANERGSIKNIRASDCQLKMAAAWALRMRDVDWSYGEGYKFEAR